MIHRVKLLPVAVLLVLAACYHATIDTGLPPSPQVIEQPWASGWVFGLVAPKPVETMAKCPSGVSKVETQLSFVNQLVAFLTLDIYTPMSIKVTCAASSRASLPAGAPALQLGVTASPQEAQDVLRRAIAQSAASGAPVYIQH